MTTTPTVRDLFISTGNTKAALTLPPVPDAYAAVVTAFQWNGLGERMLDLLDLSIVDILVRGWQKHREVRRQLRATAGDPARTALVTLASHTLTSSHVPSIEIRVQGRRLIQLACPMEIAFDVEAVELMLRGGSIRQIRPGTVKARGTVKIENTVVLQRELTPIPLARRITLDAAASELPATGPRSERPAGRTARAPAPERPGAGRYLADPRV